MKSHRPLSVCQLLAFFHNGLVGGQIAFAHGAHVVKAGIEAPFVEVVKEQAAYAAGFVAVPEVKILVAPALVAFIYIVAKRCAQIAGGLMPEAAVFVRSEEHTSELQSRGHLVCRLL